MEKLIHIADDQVLLEGMLSIPVGAQAIVIFVHGSGSSRFSPRNNFVANLLREDNLGTLLIDLLSKNEEEIYQTRFDIDLLARRLNAITEWLKEQKETRNLSIGLFGSSTGAAAALQIASTQNEKIKAIVSRGGRPDLALDFLDRVKAPTLFIIGGNDLTVLELNEKAFKKLTCLKAFEIVPNASHLFEEPGCLEEVSRIAKTWFKKYLS